MEAVIQSIIAGVPVFLIHFGITITVLAAALAVYISITPYNEFALIKEGNVAAAISLSSASIGFALPLSFCLAGSVNSIDILLWGGFILAVQLSIYFMIDRLVHNIPECVKEQKLAPVIFMGSIKLSVAMINAAAIAG